MHQQQKNIQVTSELLSKAVLNPNWPDENPRKSA